MNTRGMSQTPQIDQEILNRIVREVFERINSATPSQGVSGEAQGKAQGLSINPKRIPVGVSVRHVHLSREHLEKLFGPGAELHHMRELYQPGTHAEQETVALIGPKTRLLERVRILGPLRDRTQVELAKTDAIFLGIDAPLRLSGDLAGSAPITVIGPKGVVELSEGCIRAMRHVHMNSQEAELFGLKDGDIVKLRVGGPSGVTFENVVIRINDKTRLEVHLDTDEGNVADINCGQEVEIIKD
ncbi:phosphate propanoyltransferase [bacterium]|nr:phosphate propanoyltransferase [bacterium]